MVYPRAYTDLDVFGFSVRARGQMNVALCTVNRAYTEQSEIKRVDVSLYHTASGVLRAL